MVERIVNSTMHRAREIKQTTVQSRGRIQPAVIFHAKMHVRQMQQPQRHPRFSLSPPRLLGRGLSQTVARLVLLTAMMQGEPLIIRVGEEPVSPPEDYADGRLWCQLIGHTAVSYRLGCWSCGVGEQAIRDLHQGV